MHLVTYALIRLLAAHHQPFRGDRALFAASTSTHPSIQVSGRYGPPCSTCGSNRDFHQVHVRRCRRIFKQVRITCSASPTSLAVPVRTTRHPMPGPLGSWRLALHLLVRCKTSRASPTTRNRVDCTWIVFETSLVLVSVSLLVACCTSFDAFRAKRACESSQDNAAP
jgi:hypothetical protein